MTTAHHCSTHSDSKCAGYGPYRNALGKGASAVQVNRRPPKAVPFEKKLGLFCSLFPVTHATKDGTLRRILYHSQTPSVTFLDRIAACL
jgi:hypothetical protein